MIQIWDSRPGNPDRAVIVLLATTVMTRLRLHTKRYNFRNVNGDIKCTESNDDIL